MPDKKPIDNGIKTCKNCVHFDICCEHWAYDTDGKCTAEDYKKNMANKVPCANHFKPTTEINRLQKENKRLKKENHQFADIGKMYSEVKADAYKECIANVKKELLFIRSECRNMLDNDGVVAIENAMKKVDNLLKELEAT